MSKGIFIEGITVEMLRNACLEAVEDLLVNGDMVDIEVKSTEWIPVSERLPEKDGSYLVYMRWNYHDMDVLKWADGWNCIRRINGKVDRENEIDGADIIAWMQLPEPYEGGDDKYVD